jgi:hypothetical protein
LEVTVVRAEGTFWHTIGLLLATISVYNGGLGTFVVAITTLPAFRGGRWKTRRLRLKRRRVVLSLDGPTVAAVE